MPNTPIPGARTPLAEGSSLSRAYYLYLQSIGTNIDALSKAVDDVTARINAIAGESGISQNANVVGKFSIYTQGTLHAGIVQVQLLGDVNTAGKTQYYGSDASQTKGWFNVSDAFASTGNIEKTVDADGITSFDLAEVPDEGGGVLQKTAFDAYGRKTGTSDATSDDLTEGATHLFVSPAERAVIDALLASVIMTTAGIPIQTTTGDLLTVHL